MFNRHFQILVLSIASIISHSALAFNNDSTQETKFSPYVDVTLANITTWDQETNSMQPTGLYNVIKESGVNSLHLAFITAQNGCNGTWAGYPVANEDNSFGIPVFKKLRQQGVDLTVAFGGLNGEYLAQACKTSEQLVSAYDNVIKAYNPSALDFDIENSMQHDQAQLDRFFQAIKIIQAKYPKLPISLTLPVLPTGLVPSEGENVIQRASINEFNDYAVNIMAMDYGPSFNNKSMAQNAMDAASNTVNQLQKYYPQQSEKLLWQRMQITPMIGLNDTAPLNFTLDDAAKLKSFALKKDIKLLSYWSISRDHSCLDNHVSLTCTSADPKTGLANQQYDYQYAKALK